METKLDVAELWRDLEDEIFPKLRPTVWERCTYYHLLRHTLLTATRQIHTSIQALAARLGVSRSGMRVAVERLHAKGCIAIRAKGREGYVIDVFSPAEIRAGVVNSSADPSLDLENADFFKDPVLREAIFRREEWQCFYCLQKIRGHWAGLDHVIPQALGGDSTYRNVVACCHECNSVKSDFSVEEHLRKLYRAGRLTSRELDDRLQALTLLKSAQLKPLLFAAVSRIPRRRGKYRTPSPLAPYPPRSLPGTPSRTV